ncbi:MAG TPA: C4-dicarboxylate TRAP transporter substrate-binding protein [Burkholderiales bacterium]|nr:C4-dicarboxylate TRAP transporter substrate-binding protein [Burkholderiales bacterium]
MQKTLIAALFAALAAPISVAHAETFRLTIGAGHPVPAASWVAPMQSFLQVEVKKRVEQKTPHKIEWVEAYGGSVAKLGEVLEAIENGLLDIGDVHVPFEPSKMLAYNFGYFVPFGTENAVQSGLAAQKVFAAYPQLGANLEKRFNQVYIATGAVTCYNLVTTFAWTKVEQLAGRKIAAAGPNIPWLKAVNAVPVQSNLNEAYTSLQTGVYDGWIMIPDATYSFKLHEVARHYTITSFGAIPNTMITMNRNTWRKLPKQVQQIFLEVGREYTKLQTQASQVKSENAIKAMKEAGTTVRELSWEEKVKWANALTNIPKEKAAEISATGLPGEVVYAYIENLKALGVKFPRDWTASK